MYTAATLALALLVTSATATTAPPPPADPCNGKITTKAACDANAACDWCVSAAVPSACYTLKDAKELPAGVFVCDKKQPQQQLATVEEPALPCGWLETHASAAPDAVSFTVLVKERNGAEVERIALAVSDPRSPTYGQYLKQAQIDALTAPAAADTAAVKAWLGASSCTVRVSKARVFSVSCAAAEAGRLLRTAWRTVRHATTGQTIARTSGYSAPASVLTVLGVHGLPLPPPAKKLAAAAAAASMPVNVTPAVIGAAYDVAGVKVDRSAKSKNRQAVAEFQGQTMNSSDLKKFFAKFVPGAKAGDELVAKYIPEKAIADGFGQTEASLDIQYMMGVATGVKTEFWLVGTKLGSFCADLHQWTSKILTDDNGPLVHSVSYGFQGDITKMMGCSAADVTAVEANFAKIAAKGVTILFASGDSGSGMSSGGAACNLPEGGGKNLTQVTGTVVSKKTCPGTYASAPGLCCSFAAGILPGSKPEAAWTYTCPDDGCAFMDAKNALRAKANTAACPVGAIGTGYAGTVAVRTVAASVDICCIVASNMGAYWTFISFNSLPKSCKGKCSFDKGCECCLIYSAITKKTKSPGSTSAAVAHPIKVGDCTLFSSVTGSKPNPLALSGGDSFIKPMLFPSWPAVSPWVTSVGATRFIGQKAGNAQMATDQFGSGGGFSRAFNVSGQAAWQASDTSGYLAAAPDLPPAGSFNPKGRGTPDVSALGEGYQVVVTGEVMDVGGTSASTPAFGGMVSLLNEALLQKGKPPLGFLNPLIYQNEALFTDITVGTNAIGRGTGPLKYGFNCTKGWDPATGVGTPLFAKLLAAIMQD